jgi:hypothetical protein
LLSTLEKSRIDAFSCRFGIFLSGLLFSRKRLGKVTAFLLSLSLEVVTVTSSP